MRYGKRLFGLTLVSLYSALAGTLYLMVAMVFGAMTDRPNLPAIFGVVPVTMLVLGLALVATAYGIWTRQAWGVRTARWTYGISIAVELIMLLFPVPGHAAGAAGFVNQLVSMLLDAAVLLYLMQPHVVAQFLPDARERLA